MLPSVRGSRRTLTRGATFALLALLCELTGRSITIRLDRAFHVEPFAPPVTSYYPFLLAGVRVLGALALAALAWRIVRAHATATAGEALLRAIGQRRSSGAPRARLSLTPRRWFASFGATALWFLAQNDAERLSEGRWPLLAPWLHTYALPVFAVLSVLLALGWGAVHDWLADVEQFAAGAFAHVCHVLRNAQAPVRRRRPCDDRAPRHLFGDVFESRPPPLPA
jgi:hypothetical protein